MEGRLDPSLHPASGYARHLHDDCPRSKEGWPCPSDAAIARAYGTHSLRRARYLLTYIEDQGLIVCQVDGAGRRIVTLVELAWATAPGDPNAEELPAEDGCSSAMSLPNTCGDNNRR